MTSPWYNETAIVLALIAITVFFLVHTQRIIRPAARGAVITSAMVVVMAATAWVFFLIAGQIMRLAVTYLLGIGGLD